MHVSVHRPISRSEPQQPVPARRCKKDDFPRRNFGKEFPRGNLKEMRAALKEGRKRTEERNRAPRGHKFALRFEILSLAHGRIGNPCTRSPTRAQSGHINSLRGIRIGPFQTSGGWRTRVGGWRRWRSVAWCGMVWCGYLSRRR